MLPCTEKVTFWPSVTSNMYAKISACSLAEKVSVDPKLCRELKLNAKSKMDCRKLKLN